MGRTSGLCSWLAVAMMSTALIGAPAPALAQSRRDINSAEAVTLDRIRDNLYLLKREGGNSAVLVTDLGIVIVDTKLVGRGQAMLDKIRTISDRPVTTIINTHGHDDHTGGNEFFGTAVQVVAHQNTRGHMERMDAFEGARVNFLPKLMFKERMTLGAGKDRIELYYLGAGHTDGDAWVVFPSARVVHAGDMFAERRLPSIDRTNGGSGLAFPETLAKVPAALPGIDLVITGHGEVMTMSHLAEHARFTGAFRDVVVDGFHRGLSVAEIVERWRPPAKFKGYASDNPGRVRDNVEQMVGELAKR